MIVGSAVGIAAMTDVSGSLRIWTRHARIRGR